MITIRIFSSSSIYRAFCRVHTSTRALIRITHIYKMLCVRGHYDLVYEDIMIVCMRMLWSKVKYVGRIKYVGTVEFRWLRYVFYWVLLLMLIVVFYCSLKPQSPQATVCCKVGAAALVHLRPGGPGLPNRGFKKKTHFSIYIVFTSSFIVSLSCFPDGVYCTFIHVAFSVVQDCVLV